MVNGRILRNKNASFLLVSPTVNHLFFLLFGIFYGIMEIEREKDKKGAHCVIRIAVVDDNEMIRKQVKRFLNTYALKNSVVFEIYTYEDGHLLTLDINHEMHFDLIYLDIEMPIQNGIQVGHWIREIAQDEWMQIVFISGKDGYDRKLFSINCLDFLSKPICYSDLERTVNRFRKLTRRPEDVFTFQNNHVLQRVPIANILYFESTNRKVNIITTTDMLEFYDKLDNVESQVPTQFFRIHKSFLVNYYHIRKFEYDNVIMSNQKRLPISQSKRKEMRDLQLEIEDMEE
ncbi:LytR/AlgR family response regulator transcription factor [Ruminococcus callidus]|uniref:LytR/AlgR family response regulator transcription factor n=4 Tax=Oscillospiraceae TaxID=216572 RepID=UPI0035220D25